MFVRTWAARGLASFAILMGAAWFPAVAGPPRGFSQPSFHRSGFSQPTFQRSSFGRFAPPANFRRFDRIEDRLEAQLRRANPALFRQFDRIEDRFENRSFNRFTPSNRFGRLDRVEDRLEAQLRRANPALFRQFDRFEDRFENRFFGGMGRWSPSAAGPRWPSFAGAPQGNVTAVRKPPSPQYVYPAYGD
jgi:hypothetical protein